MWKRLFVAELICLLLLSVPVRAAGDPQVIYNASSRHFELANTDGTNLFVGFNPVMPGDKLTITVQVGVKNLNNGRVELYLDSWDEVIPEAMKTVILRVEADDELISEKTLGEALGEDTRIHIGSFTEDRIRNVDLTLTIPTSIGNELADFRQDIHWKWIAAEEDGTLVEAPDTGDKGYTGWIWLMTASGCGILMIVLWTKFKSYKG